MSDGRGFLSVSESQWTKIFFGNKTHPLHLSYFPLWWFTDGGKTFYFASLHLKPSVSLYFPLLVETCVRWKREPLVNDFRGWNFPENEIKSQVQLLLLPPIPFNSSPGSSLMLLFFECRLSNSFVECYQLGNHSLSISLISQASLSQAEDALQPLSFCLPLFTIQFQVQNHGMPGKFYVSSSSYNGFQSPKLGYVTWRTWDPAKHQYRRLPLSVTDAFVCFISLMHSF